MKKSHFFLGQVIIFFIYIYLLLAEFFPSIYGPHASRLGHKSMEKNEDL